MEATEEVAEGAVVGVRGAVGAGAALFLGEEGVEGAFPARVGTREDGRQGGERWPWRAPSRRKNVRMTFALVCRYIKHYV